ncbi:hypothetical protein V5T82_16975, partial [Magnetovibrio sp. PR-2]|uniref:hypothetical protein n=1 Tax=Magnetovibrio sp. PR-2 TaxID=3120356 RepID=UPI002FCDE821
PFNIWISPAPLSDKQSKSERHTTADKTMTSQPSPKPQRHKTMRQKIADGDVIKTSLYLDKKLHLALSNLATTTGMKANDLMIYATIKLFEEFDQDV